MKSSKKSAKVNPIPIYNSSIIRKNNIKSYLSNNYDIKDTQIDLFLKVLGKPLEEKILLYSKGEYKLQSIVIKDDDLCTESDISDSNSNIKLKNKDNIYFPDLNFEEEMRQQFKRFCDILEEDNQLYIRQNITIDDFYLLFAPYYNPVF